MRFIIHDEIAFAGDGDESTQDPMIAVDEASAAILSNEDNYKERFKKEKNLSWKQLFDCTESLRLKFDIGNDEFVVLLTEKNNDLNWFAGGSPRGKKDLFVQTAYWDYFAGSDQRYPVVYHIATVILKMHVFENFNDLNNYWHRTPKGCFMDFCENKKDIHLKLRTGDICNDCVQLLVKRKVNTRLISQVFTILDSIRSQMSFKQRYLMQLELPQMTVKGYMYKLYFPTLGDLEVHLNPLEKCLYVLYLKHPEGIELSHLPDYKDEILKIYRQISNSSETSQINKSIEDLVNPLSNSASEKISKIKKKLIEALGKEMSLPFIIAGKSGEKKRIEVSREKIRFEE
jgi:hypothetical protein